MFLGLARSASHNSCSRVRGGLNVMKFKDLLDIDEGEEVLEHKSMV